jgi:hypothetical protein
MTTTTHNAFDRLQQQIRPAMQARDQLAMQLSAQYGAYWQVHAPARARKHFDGLDRRVEQLGERLFRAARANLPTRLAKRRAVHLVVPPVRVRLPGKRYGGVCAAARH